MTTNSTLERVLNITYYNHWKGFLWHGSLQVCGYYTVSKFPKKRMVICLKKISGMKRGKAVAIACHYGRKKTNPWFLFPHLK